MTKFKRNQKVRITTDKFKGVEGIVVDADEHDKKHPYLVKPHYATIPVFVSEDALEEAEA